MDSKKLFVQDDKGNEIEYEIVLTFENPETKVNYVIYKELGDTEDVMAAIYDEKSENAGALLEITTEEEFEMIQDVLDAFMDEDDE